GEADTSRRRLRRERSVERRVPPDAKSGDDRRVKLGGSMPSNL
ncbi:hypothetical protein AVDCRST_MAG92-1882, partial [uncultured Coleofasciculus sp.]